MPAFGIYEEEIVAAFKPRLANCHIYVIGTMPAMEIVDQRLEDGRLVIGILVAGKRHELVWPMPDGVKMVETERGSFIKNGDGYRSEEHTSELQSLMRTSYAVFCMKKK